MAANKVNWGVVVMLLTCYIIAFGLAIAAEENRAQVRFRRGKKAGYYTTFSPRNPDEENN